MPVLFKVCFMGKCVGSHGIYTEQHTRTSLGWSYRGSWALGFLLCAHKSSQVPRSLWGQESPQLLSAGEKWSIWGSGTEWLTEVPEACTANQMTNCYWSCHTGSCKTASNSPKAFPAVHTPNDVCQCAREFAGWRILVPDCPQETSQAARAAEGTWLCL